ncbi:hypothetical protein VTL71DRAFT_11459, partial [Oculimacula yallundae]
MHHRSNRDQIPSLEDYIYRVSHDYSQKNISNLFSLITRLRIELLQSSPLDRGQSSERGTPSLSFSFAPEAPIEDHLPHGISSIANDTVLDGSEPRSAPQNHLAPDIVITTPAIGSLAAPSITGPSVNHPKKWLTVEGKVVTWQYDTTGTARPKFIEKKSAGRLNDTIEETLLKAVKFVHEDIAVATLVEQNAGTEQKDERRRTPFLYAAERGSVVFLQTLLDNGARWDVVDDTGRTALHLASILNSRSEVLEFLLQRTKIDINQEDDQGNTALHLAARGGNETSIQHLLDRDAEVQVGNRLGSTPLHLAAKRSLVAVETLLRIAEIPVDANNKMGRTPLMQACDRPPSEESRNIVKLLLNKKNGADPSARDLNGETPLSLAALCGNAGVVEILIDSGADVNTLNIDGNSALFGPAKYGHDETARVLLDKDIDSRVLNNDPPPGRTALLEAAKHDKFQVALLILDKWAQNSLESKDLIQSALFETAVHDSSEVARLLIERKANTSAREPRTQKTAIEIAKLRGSQRVLTLLLENGGQLFTQGPSLGVHLPEASSEADIVPSIPEDEDLDLGFGFKSTIVSFFFDDHENNTMSRPPVQDVLYNHSPEAIKSGLEVAANIGSSSKNFRWLHVPGNNPAWVTTLINRMYKECKPPEDAAYFQNKCKHLFGEQMWSRHQYQMSSTSVAHRRFVRPMCQHIPMAKTDNDNMMMVLPYFHWETTTGREKMTDAIVEAMKDCIGDISPFATTKLKGLDQALKELERARDPDYREEPEEPEELEEGISDDESGYMSASYFSDSSVSALSSDRESIRMSRGSRWNEEQEIEARPTSMDGLEATKIDEQDNMLGSKNILARREEEKRKRKRFQKVVDIARTERSADDKLILSYMFDETAPMHFRRTLDQYYYYTLPTTEARDKDQVITRYFKHAWPDDDKLVIMVDQLWLWILDNDTVVTSFPQRWDKAGKPGEKDPDPSNASDIVETILRHVRNRDRQLLGNVFDLAELIASKCIGTMFEHPDVANEKLRFAEFFEISIGKVTNEESKMFDEFIKLSESLATGEQKTADLDKLFNIKIETELIKEIKDIRDELHIISTVLVDQEKVLIDMAATIQAIKHGHTEAPEEPKERLGASYKAAGKHHSLVKSVRKHIETVKVLDKQAEKTYLSLKDLLDLKQKQANVSEARSQRQQAQATARQGQTLMLFTVITVFFLPLSFLTTFFQLDIADYVRNGQGQLALAYVSEITFPITAVVVIVSLFLAFQINPAKIARKILSSTWLVFKKAAGVLLFILVAPLIFILTFTFSGRSEKRHTETVISEGGWYGGRGRDRVTDTRFSRRPRNQRDRTYSKVSRITAALAAVAIFGLSGNDRTRGRQDDIDIIEEGRWRRSRSRGEKRVIVERSRSRRRRGLPPPPPPPRRGSVVVVEEFSPTRRRSSRRRSYSRPTPRKTGLVSLWTAVFALLGIGHKRTERTMVETEWYGGRPRPKQRGIWPPWAWFRKKPEPARRPTREIYSRSHERRQGLGSRITALLGLAALCFGLSRNKSRRRETSPNSLSYYTESTRSSNSDAEPAAPVEVGFWMKIAAWFSALSAGLAGFFKSKSPQAPAASNLSYGSGSVRSVRRRSYSSASSDRRSRRIQRDRPRERIVVERRRGSRERTYV